MRIKAPQLTGPCPVPIGPGDGICATAAGMCSLRAAIQETNILSGPDTINLPAGIYNLTVPGSNLNNDAAGGDLDITDELTVVGAGSDATITAPRFALKTTSCSVLHSGTVEFLDLSRQDPIHNHRSRLPARASR